MSWFCQCFFYFMQSLWLHTFNCHLIQGRGGSPFLPWMVLRQVILNKNRGKIKEPVLRWYLNVSWWSSCNFFSHKVNDNYFVVVFFLYYKFQLLFSPKWNTICSWFHQINFVCSFSVSIPNHSINLCPTSSSFTCVVSTLLLTDHPNFCLYLRWLYVEF